MDIHYYWLKQCRNCRNVLWEKVVKTNQREYRVKKVINDLSNGKGMITHLIAGLTKKTYYKDESVDRCWYI